MDEISFTAPDGGDPAEYFERTILHPRSKETGRFSSVSQFDAANFVDAGIFLEDQIRSRTANGVSFDGSSFVAYNDDYIKQKERAGKSTDVVNLTFFGFMLQALKTRLSPSGKNFEIGYFDDSNPTGQASKARTHNEGAFFALVPHPGTDVKMRERFSQEKHGHMLSGFVVIPARPFLGFTQEDLNRAAEIIATGNAPINPFGFTPEEMAMDSEPDYMHEGPQKRKKRRRDDF